MLCNSCVLLAAQWLRCAIAKGHWTRLALCKAVAVRSLKKNHVAILIYRKVSGLCPRAYKRGHDGSTGMQKAYLHLGPVQPDL